MADVLAIDGSTIDLVATTTTLDTLIPFAKGGVPELHFTRLLGALAALPDAWSGKSCGLSMGGTDVFAGDVVGYVDRWMDAVGWVREYRALGLIHRANYVPVTDSDTLTDTSVWDLPGDDPNFIGSRSGQTVGQIVKAVLEMTENASVLDSYGIGAWASTSPYTLPSATLTDLSALTIIPPTRATVSGDRLLASIEAFIQGCHPNHWLHVQPDGTIRFLDSRTFTGTTLTVGSDPRVGQPQLTRDHSDCYSQVKVRGNTLVRAMTLQDQPWSGSSATDGGLAEDFAWGSYTNAAAKAAWTPDDWSQPNQHGLPLDVGSCTCPDTTHVTIATSLTLAANILGQGAGDYLAQVLLFADSLGGSITQIVQARVVSNTATSGGHSTLTLDVALPATVYNSYQLFGITAGANAVGRRYKVTNTAIASKMLNFFPYPVPYVPTGGTAAEMTSTPIGAVYYTASGGTTPPFNSITVGITLDPDNGLVYFDAPVQVVAYGTNTPVQWPAIVQAFVPVAVGMLEAWAPSSSTYGGTLYTVEGISRTKVITVLEWKDYSNQSNMDAFASEWLDAVKDVVVEGTVPYLGLASSYLAPGKALSIAGSGYTTGWETLALPVVSVEVGFQPGPQGTSYVTTLQLSNRKGRYSPSNYLKPNIAGMQLGAGGGGLGDGPVIAAAPAAYGGIAANSADVAAASMQGGGGGNPYAQAEAGLSDLYGGASAGLSDLYGHAGGGE